MEINTAVIKNIGQNIKRFRTQKGLTQTAVADAIHVTPQAVSRWETGACYPDLESLINLAVYLHVTVDDLLRK
ncbi:MAG: helix-turn-helix transcriptional regulator [Clostridia bacterium]|nr:helix-turn-helix transcriptional regulator [Clostridia bacterium]